MAFPTKSQLLSQIMAPILSRPFKCTSHLTGTFDKGDEIVDDVIANKLLVPFTTRWNSFYNAPARITEIPMAELNTISSKLQVNCISEREQTVLCCDEATDGGTGHSPGRRQLFFGTLLPTLGKLMSQPL